MPSREIIRAPPPHTIARGLDLNTKLRASPCAEQLAGQAEKFEVRLHVQDALAEHMTPAFSFIIPFLNEEATLAELFDRIEAVVRPIMPPGRSFEVIFVDDGSTDGSVAVVERLIEAHPEVRLVQLRGNFGKSAALAAGFDHARGDVIFTLDADLQDDPKEIPRFLEELEHGNDVVSGFKRTRHDPVTKVISSRLYNWVVRRFTGVALHDINCGFKAYRAEVIHDVHVYGDLHRLIPVLAKWNRFRISEVVVDHHPRRHGRSKYGFGRSFEGLTDLLTVVFLMRYDRKPSHFFAGLGSLMTLAGLVICSYLTVLKVLGEAIGHRPLLMLGVLLIVIGAQVLVTGLLAELLVHVAGTRPPYNVRRLLDGRVGVASASEPTLQLEETNGGAP
jgi:glycosyltransferase involved in cell wall biosynthesis